MFLGVPVLRRYDLLERLIASAEAGIPPKGYLIVDNGGEFRTRLENSVVVQHVLKRGAEFRLLEQGENIGVAAAWNAILDEAGEQLVVISNDDIELGYASLVELVDAYNSRPGDLFIADSGPDANGWCLFLHSPELYKKIGPYDESFSPAYYEDSDYRWRMKLEDIEPVLVKTEFKHHGWGSLSDETNKILRRSLEQFERKWGGDPRGDESLLFRVPFDGAPVTYPLRKRSYRGAWRTLSRRIYRWDIINTIAKKIGAKSYLEIGIGSGETLRKVEIPWKEGVDPAPAPGGPDATNVFYRGTSDAFFDGLATKPYDIIFVDGLHHADQALRDIENACAISRVVVVHDANPTTEAMQHVPQVQGEWTGDVWKAIARIRDDGTHAVCTIDTDYGVAVVIPNRGERMPHGSAGGRGAPCVNLPRETWEDLERNRTRLLGLLSPNEWETWFDNYCVVPDP